MWRPASTTRASRSPVARASTRLSCHGIPGPYRLRSGDIINVDLTTIVDGWYGDQSETFLIGQVSPVARRLVQVAFDCLYLGIHAVDPGDSVMEIGLAIAEHAEGLGFSVGTRVPGTRARSAIPSTTGCAALPRTTRQTSDDRTRHVLHDRTHDQRGRLANQAGRPGRLDDPHRRTTSCQRSSNTRSS